MAKKTPKTDTSTVEQTSQARVEKAAVNVDSKNQPQNKAKKKVNNKKSDKPNIFKRMWKGIKGIFSELKKVTWPKGKEVGNNTLVVVVVVILFFVILFAIDYVLSGILGLVTNGKWTTMFI